MASSASRVDPRDHTRITPLSIASIPTEQLPPDYYVLIGLIFAFLAIMTRFSVYSWITCLFCFASIANQRFSSMDINTVVATIALVVLTFISTHFSFNGQPIMSPMLPWLKH